MHKFTHTLFSQKHIGKKNQVKNVQNCNQNHRIHEITTRLFFFLFFSVNICAISWFLYQKILNEIDAEWRRIAARDNFECEKCGKCCQSPIPVLRYLEALLLLEHFGQLNEAKRNIATSAIVQARGEASRVSEISVLCEWTDWKPVCQVLGIGKRSSSRTCC